MSFKKQFARKKSDEAWRIFKSLELSKKADSLWKKILDLQTIKPNQTMEENFKQRELEGYEKIIQEIHQVEKLLRETPEFKNWFELYQKV